MDVPGRFTPAMTALPWYVVVNDLVGGYAISHINKPLSQQDFREGEGELFDALTEELARYVVDLHNARLKDHGRDRSVPPVAPTSGG